MIVADLTESQESVLTLSPDQAEQLRAVASRLGTAQSSNDLEDNGSGSVLTVRPVGGSRWSVRVNEAVGVIAIDGVTLLVRPKIPQAHLMYLLERGGYVPRLDRAPAALNDGGDLWRILCLWFLREAEALLRRGLARDYREKHESLSVVRGRIRPVQTVVQTLRGRPSFDCTFEEFDEDTPLNRIVLAAAKAVSGSTPLERSERRRGYAVAQAMLGVGALRHGDLRTTTTRATADYAGPLALARLILSATGPDFQIGEERAWSFLIRTPEVVEEGVRSVLNEHWRGSADSVRKASVRLPPTTLTLTPDLVFAPSGLVGDVKYRVGDGKWHRPHLYQATTFATALGSRAALVIAFATSHQEPAPRLYVGPVALSSIYWDARPGTPPAEAGLSLAEKVHSWVLGEAAAA